MKEKLLKIINTYEVIPQLKYFQSEVFELNEAIISAEHSRCVGITRDVAPICIEHIAEEIADCTVMLKQFQYYYGIEDKEIEKVMKYKIDRQLERIKEGK